MTGSIRDGIGKVSSSLYVECPIAQQGVVLRAFAPQNHHVRQIPGLGVARSHGRSATFQVTIPWKQKASDIEIVLCKYIRIVVAQLPLGNARVRTLLCAESKQSLIVLLLLQAQVAKL